MALAENGRGFRLNGKDFNIRVLLFKIFAYSGKCAAGAYACNECVNLALGVCPNFGACGFIVSLGICGVNELAEDNGAGSGIFKLICLFNCAFHSLCAFGKNNLCTVCFNKIAPFNAHRFGHGKDNIITLCGAHACKADAGVARCGLNDCCAGFKLALCFRVGNHCVCNSVFNRACGVEVFKLCKNICVHALCLCEIV